MQSSHKESYLPKNGTFIAANRFKNSNFVSMKRFQQILVMLVGHGREALFHVFAAVCLLVSVVTVGCSRSSGDTGHHRLTVTVSLPPQEWILSQIAGDSININTLLESGGNPETFDPGIGVIKKAAKSDILMLSGQLGFENRLAQRLTAGNNDITVVDTSAGITPIYGTHSHAGYSHHDCDDGDEAIDPHTWTSVKNVRVIARNMLRSLVEADPGNAAYYRQRAAKFDSRLDSLDRDIAERLSSPSVSRSFLIWHPSLSYLARDYGLEQIPIGSENREITVQDIRQTLDKAASSGARVLFMQSDYDPRQAASLSSQTGVNVVPINPLDRDWENQIKLITEALTDEALD